MLVPLCKVLGKLDVYTNELSEALNKPSDDTLGLGVKLGIRLCYDAKELCDILLVGEVVSVLLREGVKPLSQVRVGRDNLPKGLHEVRHKGLNVTVSNAVTQRGMESLVSYSSGVGSKKVDMNFITVEPIEPPAILSESQLLRFLVKRIGVVVKDNLYAGEVLPQRPCSEDSPSAYSLLSFVELGGIAAHSSDAVLRLL